MTYVIETDQLVKKFGRKEAVSHISLHIEAGDIYGLIGKNGAGKTTLMRLLLGLHEANEGSMHLFDGEDLSVARRRIGSIVEEPGLYYGKDAYQNMKIFSLLYDGVTDADIHALLAKVGLGDVGKKKVKGFSLGMRQRLGLAIALMGKPELLILDEPINGLDPTGIKEIRDLILEMNAEGITFMISSHLLDELGKIATRYGIMEDGKLVEELSTEELKVRCTKCLVVLVDHVDEAIRILKEQFDGIEIQKGEEKGSVKILSELEDPSEISKTLVTSGIRLFAMYQQGASIEEFFLGRTEGVS